MLTHIFEGESLETQVAFYIKNSIFSRICIPEFAIVYVFSKKYYFANWYLPHGQGILKKFCEFPVRVALKSVSCLRVRWTKNKSVYVRLEPFIVLKLAYTLYFLSNLQEIRIIRDFKAAHTWKFQGFFTYALSVRERTNCLIVLALKRHKPYSYIANAENERIFTEKNALLSFPGFSCHKCWIAKICSKLWSSFLR